MTARVSADQLDAATRARLGLGKATGRKPSPTKAGSGGWSLVCRACGYVPGGPTAAGRHSDDTDHRVWEYPLPGGAGQARTVQVDDGPRPPDLADPSQVSPKALR